MKKYSLETAQHVQLDFTPAGLGERILAYIIDYLIMIAYLFFMIFIFSFTLDALNKVVQGILIFFTFSPLLFYSLIFESIMDGQSIGKRVRKIKVVKLDGSPLRFIDILLRWVLTLVDISFSYGLGAVISIAVTEKSQRIGDLAAGTSVVRIQDDISLEESLFEHVEETYSPSYSNVLNLSDRDIELIKEVIQNAERKTSEASYLAVRKLAEKIKDFLKIESSEKNLNFLKKILSDYNYYVQRL